MSLKRMDTNVSNSTQAIIQGGNSTAHYNNPTISNVANFNFPPHNQAIPVQFNHEDLLSHLKKLEIDFEDVLGNKKRIDASMFDHTTLIRKTDLYGSPDLDEKEVSSLEQLFPNGAPDKKIIAFTGEPGAGKTVLLKMQQQFFIKKGYFVFNIECRKLDKEDKLSFGEFLATYGGYLSYSYNCTESFEKFLLDCENLIIIIDGLDECSIDFKKEPKPVPLDKAKDFHVESLLKLLMNGEYLPLCKIILGSRPLSLVELHRSFRPDTVYSLNGFATENLKRVVEVYNKNSSDQVVASIKDKQKNGNVFFRSPFVISLLSSLSDTGKDISKFTTLTEIYREVFDTLLEWSNKSEDESEETLMNAEKQEVDRFFYKMHKKKKVKFSEKDAEEHEISLSQIQKHSFVKIETDKPSRRVKNEHKIATPRHLSIVEFHCARHLFFNEDFEHFKEFVKNQLFSIDDQDRKVFIRRFLSGFADKAEKGNVILKQLVEETKKMMTGHLFEKYPDRTDRRKARLAVTHLIDDIGEVESKENVKYMKNLLNDGSKYEIEVKLEDRSSLEKVISFFKKLDPHINLFKWIFAPNTRLEEFQRLVPAFSHLSNKINTLEIRSLNVPGLKQQDLKKILENVGQRLFLYFCPHKADVQQFQMAGKSLRHYLNTKEESNVFVEIQGPGSYYKNLIRHSSYTSKTPPLVMKSHFIKYNDGANKTVNLIAFGQCRENEGSLVEISNNLDFEFDFVISKNSEVSNIGQVFAKYPEMKVGILNIYFEAKVPMKHVEYFIRCFLKQRIKVNSLNLLNIPKWNSNLKKWMEALIIQTKKDLNLFFTSDFGGEGQQELQSEIRELQSDIRRCQRKLNKTLRIYLNFKDCKLSVLPKNERWNS